MKTRLLASVCALGLLAAAPAFATGNTGMSSDSSGSGPMGYGGSMHTHADGMTGSTGRSGNAGMSDTTGMSGRGGMAGDAATTQRHGMENGARTHDSGVGGQHGTSTWHATRADRRHSTRADRGHAVTAAHARRSATAHNPEVARLNTESLRAARDGHAFQVGSAATRDDDAGRARGAMGGADSAGAPDHHVGMPRR